MRNRPSRAAKDNAPNYNINQLSIGSVKREPEAEAPPKKPATKKKKNSSKKSTPKAAPKANTGRVRQPAAGADKKTRGRPRAAPAPEDESDSSSDAAAVSSALTSATLTSAKLKEIEDELKDNKRFRVVEKKTNAVKKRADKRKADAKKKKEKEKDKRGKGKKKTARSSTATPKAKAKADKPVRKGRVAKKSGAPKKKADDESDS
jgi:hypothetical protein